VKTFLRVYSDVKLYDAEGRLVPQSERPFWPLGVAAALIFGAAFLPLLLKKQSATGSTFNPDTGPVIFTSGGYSTSGTSSGYFTGSLISAGNDAPQDIPITAGPYHRQMLEALEEWRKALPGVKIPTPRLVRGRCPSGGESLACASMGGNTIWVPAHEDTTKAVFLHEIGHLLGVPHISGDALMDPMYHAEVEKPTPAAIALAKLYLAGRKGNAK